MDPSALDGETAHEKGPSVPLERVGLIGGGLAETAVRGVCICTFLYVLPVECGYESARCMCHMVRMGWISFQRAWRRALRVPPKKMEPNIITCRRTA